MPKTGYQTVGTILWAHHFGRQTAGASVGAILWVLDRVWQTMGVSVGSRLWVPVWLLVGFCQCECQTVVVGVDAGLWVSV